MSICSGAELGVNPVDGSLRVRNTRPGTWPAQGSVCQPSDVSDLNKDPALGLWVPPVEFATFAQRTDSGQIEQSVGFGSWYLNTSVVPGSQLPVAVCSTQQAVVLSTFVINATVPQNAGLAWTLYAGPDAIPSMPPTGYLEHGRFKGFADSGIPAGSVFTMARTDTLTRYIGNNVPDAPQTLNQFQAVTAFEHGSGAASPIINRLIIETVVYVFDAPGPLFSSLPF